MQRLPSVFVDVRRKSTTHGDVGIKDELPISTYILDVVGRLVLQYFPVVSGYAHLSHRSQLSSQLHNYQKLDA